MRQIAPDTIAAPRSNYAPGIAHKASAERLVISGQLGIKPDGTLEPTTEAQMERAFLNILAILKAAGFKTTDLVKITMFVTEPGRTDLYRRLRDKHLEGHKCAATYLQIAGLASPEFKVELEAEAVRE